MQNWEQTLASQYANSPILLALIDAFNSAIDPGPAIDAFYADVWDITTATGYGLDVWGRIVGVKRILTLPSGSNTGFAEGPSGDPWGESSWYFGQPASNNYIIGDAIYRKLILAKALANISGATIPTYNRMLQLLFPGRGNAFATDTGGMVMLLSFAFSLEAFEIAMLQQSGVFSAPTGVTLQIGYLPNAYDFGFAEAAGSAQPFNQGVFFGGFA